MKDIVNWDLFTPTLEDVFGPPRTSIDCQLPWDNQINFRSILLGVLNGLSDGQLQFMLLNQYSFKQFVGLQSGNQVLRLKTLWKYRNQLSQSGRLVESVGMFQEQLATKGYRLKTGKHIEASMISAPRQL